MILCTGRIIWVFSLGDNNREVVTSINELLDLETDRAMVMLKKIAAVKPMKESEINELGMCELEGLCEDLVPANLLHEETLEEEGHVASLSSPVGPTEDISHTDSLILPQAPMRKRQKRCMAFLRRVEVLGLSLRGNFTTIHERHILK